MSPPPVSWAKGCSDAESTLGCPGPAANAWDDPRRRPPFSLALLTSRRHQRSVVYFDLWLAATLFSPGPCAPASAWICGGDVTTALPPDSPTPVVASDIASPLLFTTLPAPSSHLPPNPSAILRNEDTRFDRIAHIRSNTRLCPRQRRPSATSHNTTAPHLPAGYSDLDVELTTASPDLRNRRLSGGARSQPAWQSPGINPSRRHARRLPGVLVVVVDHGRTDLRH